MGRWNAIARLIHRVFPVGSMIFRARTLLASWSLDSLKLLIAHSEASEIGTDLRALVRVFDDCSWTGQMLEDDWCAILGVK